MVRRTAASACMILALLIVSTGSAILAQESNSRPKLAIVLVVDQMRADYLNRWSDMFSGGLRRLLDNGAVFTNAHHDHAATVTATGHATIATGVIPAKHGIVGNSFYDRNSGEAVGCVTDSSTKIIGGAGGPGASPRWLMCPTIGDRLKQSSPGGRVFTAALKDRAAILMGGKSPDGVFWYDKPSGDFVTSSYYSEVLPSWADSFNNSGAKDIWKDSLWIEHQTAVDSEEHADGPDMSAFSHVLSTESSADDYYAKLYEMPFGDELLLKFGLDLIPSEHLGEDSIPDLLMISLSAADLVGHAYGPDSREIRDYYLRLDSELGMFLDSLDTWIGSDNYVLVLTSDHGVCPIPELAVNNGLKGYQRLFAKSFQMDVADILPAVFLDCSQTSALLKPFYNGFVIDTAAAAKCGLSRSTVAAKAANAIGVLDYVANVFTMDQLSADSISDQPYFRLFKNSFYPDRSPDLIVNFKEGVLLTSSGGGTSHGTPYHYDTDVPIVFCGKNIKPMTDNDSVRTVDIAPTLGALLNIPSQSEMDGKILPVIK